MTGASSAEQLDRKAQLNLPSSAGLYWDWGFLEDHTSTKEFNNTKPPPNLFSFQSNINFTSRLLAVSSAGRSVQASTIDCSDPSRQYQITTDSHPLITHLHHTYTHTYSLALSLVCLHNFVNDHCFVLIPSVRQPSYMPSRSTDQVSQISRFFHHI